jgi:starvation-inducible DNA-binding protein
MPTQRIEELNQLLADEAVYYQKLRNFHWNVRGPAFFQLHVKFEELYTASALNVDAIAERILALGGRPKSTLREFLDASRIKEQPEVPVAEKMVAELRDNLNVLVGYANTVRKTAEKAGDDTTINLLDDLSQQHEQDAWMLRAWLS